MGRGTPVVYSGNAAWLFGTNGLVTLNSYSLSSYRVN